MQYTDRILDLSVETMRPNEETVKCTSRIYLVLISTKSKGMTKCPFTALNYTELLMKQILKLQRYVIC